ncbi:MAG: hypothetical protein Q9170_002508 [Blastenia crenularia]
MSLPTFSTKSPTMRRILKEATELRNNPDATLHAAPLETNLFEWHFTLQGPPSTPYASGIYHGRIILPPTYPLRPPSFRFLTPSGRFEVNREICLSISGHHEETWQPAWGIRTALWALRAFMEGGAKGQVGGMDMGEEERKRLAGESRSWRCQGCGRTTNEDILKAEEGRCTAPDENQGSAKLAAKEHVPNDLRFGFKDEMAKVDVPSEGKDKALVTPRLTDYKDETVSSDRGGNVDFAGHENLSSSSHPLSLRPQPPAPTTASAQPMPQPLPTPRTSVPPNPTNGVPAWVDKAIVGVVASLAVMVVKKIAI